MRFSIVIFYLSLAPFLVFSGVNSSAKDDFVPKVVIVKIKQDFRYLCKQDSIEYNEFNRLIQKHDIISVQRLFNTSPHRSNSNSTICLIYELTTKNDVTPKLIADFKNCKIVQYAERKVINHVAYTPSDPMLTQQWYLDTLHAFEVWDSLKGDTNVVIGIVDTGIDLDHEDLKDAIKYNYSDPIDGIDNDNDGYVDNFIGWDLSDNDNSPQESTNFPHGTSVAGAAVTKTDNAIGIAGVGFNCKLLPVKVSKDAATSTSGLDKSYEGIVYAVDHGATIINCSWGSSYRSQYGNDIVQYAFDNGAIVVAAAGNTSSDEPHYPAAFEHVLAVANSMKSDVMAPNSGRGNWVDVCAPGTSILTTYNGDDYKTNSGTSYAAPIASGVAAMVKSKHPSLSNQQIEARILNTTIDISKVVGNEFYKNQLGQGRINMLDAVLKTKVPGITLKSYTLNDNENQQWEAMDTISLQVDLINLLDSTSGLKARLSSTSSHIQVVDSSYYIGALGNLDSTDNSISPFTFSILGGVPFNHEVDLLVEISDTGDYKRNFIIPITVNNTYVDVAINNISLTVSGNGNIGYFLDNQAGGLGIRYKNGPSLLYDASFMVGVPGKVLDMARNSTGSNDQDFTPSIAPYIVSNPVLADLEVKGRFTDSIASSDKLNIEVEHTTYAWDQLGHENYVIQEYTIWNRGNSSLSNLFTGIFADWDIDDANNFVASNNNEQIGYCHNVSETMFVGIKELTNWRFSHHGMYNNAVDGGGVNPNNSFTSNDKYKALSTFQWGAGWGSGQDISQVVSTGAFNLSPNDSITVAFAIMVEESLQKLFTTADSAKMKYTGKLNGLDELHQINNVVVYPNPASDIFLIDLPTNSTNYQLEIFNSLGQKVYQVAAISKVKLATNKIGPQGVYLVRVSENNSIVSTAKLIIR